MKSLVEYIKEQMLLEYAGVFNGADEIAEDLYELICNRAHETSFELTYNVNKYINDKFKEINLIVHIIKGSFSDVGAKSMLPDIEHNKCAIQLNIKYTNNIEKTLSTLKDVILEKIIHEITHALQRYSNYAKFITDINSNLNDVLPLKLLSKTYVLELCTELSLISHEKSTKDSARIMYYLDDFERNAYLSQLEESLKYIFKNSFKNYDFSIPLNTDILVNELVKFEPWHTFENIKLKLQKGLPKETIIELKKFICLLQVKDKNDLNIEYAKSHYDNVSDKDVSNFLNCKLNKFFNKLKSNIPKLSYKIIYDKQNSNNK